MDRDGVRMVAELDGGPGVEAALSGCVRQALNTSRSLLQENAISGSKALDRWMGVVRYSGGRACMDAWSGSEARRCRFLLWRQGSIASAFATEHPAHSTRLSRPSHLLLILPPLRYCTLFIPFLHYSYSSPVSTT